MIRENYENLKTKLGRIPSLRDFDDYGEMDVVRFLITIALVSHVFSDRMSSRPLGWSRTGCDKMARLRVYQKIEGICLN